jgi:predicted RNA-binding protein with PIN domain
VSGEAPDLGGAEADRLLRPAAELAFEVAQAGARMQPPLDVPSRLRPVVGHAKVTRAALSAARRAVEDDPAFRERVARALDVAGVADVLGRAGVLWLLRPDGWEAELAGLVAEERAAAAATADETQERDAQRRLRHAEEARDRAERATDDARRALQAARLELQEERRLRREAEDGVGRSARHVAALEEQLLASRRRASAAADQLAERTDAEGAAAAAAAALRDEVHRLRAALAERSADAALAEAPRAPERSPAPDQRAVAEAVAAASAAAAALGAALGRAALALEATGAAAPALEPAPAEEGPPADRDPPSPTRPRWVRRQRRGTSRRPAPLPPLVHDDSAEAAEHLVRLPNVSLLVDGYNATLSTWPDLPLPEQRRRLVDALAELAARTGARPEVVFDGAEVVPARQAAPPPRSLVKVTFTSSDVEADDELIARARSLHLPVVVASDDRRVRSGARAAGANVLGVDQLLAALRRVG